MTNAECDEFISYLTSLFPDVERWLIEQNEAAKDKGLGEEVVQSAWYRSLAFVTLKGARQAVDIMLGDEDQQPKGYTKLPARIVKIAKENNELIAKSKRGAKPVPRLVDGQWVFACAVCQDQGMVVVFRGEAMDAVRLDGEFLWVKHAKPVSMRCHCAYGQTFHKSMVTFDERKFVLMHGGSPTEEDIVRLATFCGVAYPRVVKPVHERPILEDPPPLGPVKPIGKALASPVASAEVPKREKLPEPKRFRPEPDEVPWDIDEANDLLRGER